VVHRAKRHLIEAEEVRNSHLRCRVGCKGQSAVQYCSLDASYNCDRHRLSCSWLRPDLQQVGLVKIVTRRFARLRNCPIRKSRYFSWLGESMCERNARSHRCTQVSRNSELMSRFLLVARNGHGYAPSKSKRGTYKERRARCRCQRIAYEEGQGRVPLMCPVLCTSSVLPLVSIKQVCLLSWLICRLDLLPSSFRIILLQPSSQQHERFSSRFRKKMIFDEESICLWAWESSRSII
jgi:hypothetical protein